MAGGCEDYWRETSVVGVPVRYCRCGTGSPVVILHHDIGCPDRADFAQALSGAHDVLMPVHPGFGLGSERAEWMRSVRDLAVLYRGLLAGLGIGRASLVGLGFGGWVAAEMASMAPADVDRLVLVGAMGLQPREGFILDQALIGYIDYAEAFFKDPAAFDAVYGREPTTDQLEAWDICREMCFRIAWKPYMYSQTLAPLLGSVTAPALVVHGADDEVVPADCAEQYAAALPNARLETVADCGHA
ncbi:MAG: alpha/beta hydrolase, partial [Alphaproteobacteria bacterium]|nr:alpha/beta hydrolase [Alphaproteobacteria bacterium]